MDARLNTCRLAQEFAREYHARVAAYRDAGPIHPDDEWKQQRYEKGVLEGLLSEARALGVDAEELTEQIERLKGQ